MKQKQLAGLFSFIMLLPAWTTAAPSLQGSTGNLVTPSADVVRPGQFDLGYYRETGEKTAVAAVGMGKNWELSAARRERDHGADYTAVNLKYAVTQESITEPGLALGVEDISAEEERSLYVVASKGLPFGISLHAGCGNGSYGGLFYAVEKKITPHAAGGVFPDASVLVENNGHETDYGLRLSLSKGLKATVGWRDGEKFIGFTYNYY